MNYFEAHLLCAWSDFCFAVLTRSYIKGVDARTAAVRRLSSTDLFETFVFFPQFFFLNTQNFKCQTLWGAKRAAIIEEKTPNHKREIGELMMRPASPASVFAIHAKIAILLTKCQGEECQCFHPPNHWNNRWTGCWKVVKQSTSPVSVLVLTTFCTKCTLD